LLDKSSEDFKIIETYASQTKGWNQCNILDVWKVEREDEVQRFKEHDNIENRKLLWHGTNVAVVAAILKTGNIMNLKLYKFKLIMIISIYKDYVLCRIRVVELAEVFILLANKVNLLDMWDELNTRFKAP